MRVRWSSLIYFLVIVGLSINSAMYWLKPKKVEVPVVDTVFVSEASEPDTVIRYKVKSKEVVDTVYIKVKEVTEPDTILLIDTLYVYRYFDQDVYESTKDFRIKQGTIRVRSYGPAPADSIKINFLLDFDEKISYICNSPEDMIFAGSALGVAAYGLTAGDLKSTLYLQSGVTATYLLYKLFLKHKLKRRGQ